MKRGDKIKQGIIGCVVVNEQNEPVGVYIMGTTEYIPINEIKSYESDDQLKLIL